MVGAAISGADILRCLIRRRNFDAVHVAAPFLAIGIVGVTLNGDGPLWITGASVAFSLLGATIAVVAASRLVTRSTRPSTPQDS